MQLVPEWAPNVHPLFVHFPLALILTAIGADVMALVLRRWNWLRAATVALYVAGGVAAVVTYLTGTWAADAVSVPAAAEGVLSEHSDLAWWTMWFFGLYALLRLGALLWPKTRGRASVHAVLLLVALGGSYFLYETGEHGAELVFRYGVGVQQAQETTVEIEPGLTIGETGWQWQPTSDTAWKARMDWLEGGPSDVQSTLDTTTAGDVGLKLRPRSPVTFAIPDTIGAVQVLAELNLDEFTGRVTLVHHIQGANSYDFLAVEDSTLDLGRVVPGKRTSFASGSTETTGWRVIRAVGDGTHFRGYVDGNMVAHGHGDRAQPGMQGLRIDGTGTLILRRLSAEGL